MGTIVLLLSGCHGPPAPPKTSTRDRAVKAILRFMVVSSVVPGCHGRRLMRLMGTLVRKPYRSFCGALHFCKDLMAACFKAA
jgi:hypothetical protein